MGMTQACQAWPVCIIRLSQAHSESDLQALEGPRPPNHSPMLWFVVVMYSLSHAQLFATPWTIVLLKDLMDLESMELSRSG